MKLLTIKFEEFTNILFLVHGDVSKNSLAPFHHFCNATIQTQRVPKYMESRADCGVKVTVKKKGGKVLRSLEFVQKKEGKIKVLTEMTKEVEREEEIYGEPPPGVDKNSFDILTREQQMAKDSVVLPFMEKQKEESSVGRVSINENQEEEEEEQWDDEDLDADLDI